MNLLSGNMTKVEVLNHKNLTYLKVTLTGRILRWKLFLQDKDLGEKVSIVGQRDVEVRQVLVICL
jgi:hypothetical protein